MEGERSRGHIPAPDTTDLSPSPDPEQVRATDQSTSTAVGETEVQRATSAQARADQPTKYDPMSESVERDLEASMRASEEELRHVTRSVRRSFTDRQCAPTPRACPSTTMDASTISSRSSGGVMEQLMAEMDQVFHRVLETEDELKLARLSMTTASDTSSYLGHSDSLDLDTSSVHDDSLHNNGFHDNRLHSCGIHGNSLRCDSLDFSNRLDENSDHGDDSESIHGNRTDSLPLLPRQLSADTLMASVDDVRRRAPPVEAEVRVRVAVSRESMCSQGTDREECAFDGTHRGDTITPDLTNQGSGCVSDRVPQLQDRTTDRAYLSDRVPLAEMEKLSESTEDGTRTVSEDNLDAPSPADTTDTASATKTVTRKRKRASKTSPTLMNGPVAGADQHVVDMNGNGTSKYRRWLSRIESYDDGERRPVGETSGRDDGHYDMLDFARKYYNTHYHPSAYSSALSKTVHMVRRKSLSDTVPVEDLLKYPKSSSIPTSHVHLLDTEDVTLACSIFKDVCRYMRGEVKTEGGHSLVSHVVTLGLDHIALRDEIYCQLLRFTAASPSTDATLRAWSALCLCSCLYCPSKTLRKYLFSYLRQHCNHDDLSGRESVIARVSRHAEYCLTNLQKLEAADKPRKKPPSTTELQALCDLRPLDVRIHFLDSSSKSVPVGPTDTSEDVVRTLSEMIGLRDPMGWALYESTPTHDRTVRRQEYLTDILADWEDRQRHSGKLPLLNLLRKQKDRSNPSTPKKGSPLPASLGAYGKLVMCKRLVQRVADIPDDPMEIHLQYIQAVHHVVHLDEYLVPPKVAVHLAGLQAQVEFGDHDDDKLHRYQCEENFLSQRVLCCLPRDWGHEISSAHKRFGRSKERTEAELRYLTIVSQFQLYGCSKIFAHYRGVWPYGIETILAVNYDGIKCISLQEKVVVFDYLYADIESIVLEERYEECHIILQLSDAVPHSRQKCYMFECLGLEDFASLVEHYSPQHALWTQNKHSWRLRKFRPTSDWLKLYDDILLCRRTLLQTGIMNKPSSTSGGLLKAALNKLSGRSYGAGHQETAEECSPFWSFSRVPFRAGLSNCTSHEMQDVSARMFNSTLVYTGLESAAVLEDMDLVVVVQTLIKKCMDNENLCNEFYLQLVKQTTDTQAEVNQKAVARYWNLMTMATCVMLPPNETVFNYVNLHLRRYAIQRTTEEGQYAYFCIKSLYRTYENKGRKNPPSYKEIHFVTAREPIEARVHLSDGHAMLVEFDSATTANELIQVIKAKAGMRLDAEYYGIFQTLSDRELYIKPDEKLADALYNWERSYKHELPVTKDLNLIFKKRLFLEPYMNLSDPLEVDLLYNQSVTDVFEQKIPLTKPDATALCALRAQCEYGDFDRSGGCDYSAVMRILPRHMRDLLCVPEIMLHHRAYAGLSHIQANVAFLHILQHWPLYGATIFPVTQTSIDSLPHSLWLAVSPIGLHLTEIKGPEIYVTHAFSELTSVKPASKNLSVIIGDESEEAGYLFFTPEADQIVQLIDDYREVLDRRTRQKSSQTTTLDESDSVNLDTLELSS